MKYIFSLCLLTFCHFAQSETKFPEDKLQQVQDILDESKPLEVIHKIERSPEVKDRSTSGGVKYLMDIIKHAKSEDFSDMTKLLDQLHFIPYQKDPPTGVQIFKVTKIKKSSLFDKAGLKIGDLFVNGSSADHAVSTSDQ